MNPTLIVALSGNLTSTLLIPGLVIAGTTVLILIPLAIHLNRATSRAQSYALNVGLPRLYGRSEPFTREELSAWRTDDEPAATVRAAVRATARPIAGQP